jgi:hypothetical protein
MWFPNTSSPLPPFFPRRERFVISKATACQALEGVKHIFLFKQVGDMIESYHNCADRPCYVIVQALREKVWDIFETEEHAQYKQD